MQQHLAEVQQIEKDRQQARHRGDIQGMRAVAVALVMLDHADIPGFQGGYLGVDVFFVLSGFLITGILLREVRRTGRVSIAGFYARRARRILPAASVVLLAIVLASSQVFGYLRIDEVLTDVTWAALFAANIHSALSGSDYFAMTTFVSPVQHFWSLAVEEQFYLVWPPLIALVVFTRRRAGRAGTGSAPDPSRTARRLRRLTMVIALLCGLSLAWSVWQTSTDASAAYYSTLARAWELGAGALLALSTDRVTRLPRAVKLAASWIGLAAIAIAAATYSPGTPFPGYHALLPVLGAVLVLAGGMDGPRYGAALVLDRLPMRWLGDISYSLYLWHWPLLVMPVTYLGRDLRLSERVALMVAAIVVSALSYRFVETPVRRAPFLSRRRLTALVMWPVTAAVLISSVAVVRSQYGQPAAAAEAGYSTPTAGTGQGSGEAVVTMVRSAAELARAGSALPRGLKPSLDDLWDDVTPPPAKCSAERDDTKHPICTLGDTTASRTIVLFGDSHLAMWLEPLQRTAEARHWKIIPFIKASCFPADVTEWRQDKLRIYTECDIWRQWAIAEIGKIKPDRIILSGLINQIFADAESGKPITNEESKAVFAAGAESTLKKLRKASRSVHMISGTPNLDQEPTDCLAGRRATMASCAGPIAPLVEQRNRAWKAAAQATGAHWVDTVPWFCDERTCPLVVGNVIVYRDTNHITRTYATTLRGPLARELGL